jgi:hypothetical protein
MIIAIPYIVESVPIWTDSSIFDIRHIGIRRWPPLKALWKNPIVVKQRRIQMLTYFHWPDAGLGRSVLGRPTPTPGERIEEGLTFAEFRKVESGNVFRPEILIYPTQSVSIDYATNFCLIVFLDDSL